MKFHGYDAFWERLVVDAIKGNAAAQATIDEAIAKKRLQPARVKLTRQILRKHRYKWDWQYRERAKAASRRHYRRMPYSARRRKARRAMARRDPWGRWNEGGPSPAVLAEIISEYGIHWARRILNRRRMEEEQRAVRGAHIQAALKANYKRNGERRGEVVKSAS